MKTIAERGSDFEAAVLDPVQAEPLQRREMRRAFYAGFFSSLMAGVEMADESGDDDPAGVRMLQALHDECREFGLAINAGKA